MNRRCRYVRAVCALSISSGNQLSTEISDSSRGKMIQTLNVPTLTGRKMPVTFIFLPILASGSKANPVLMTFKIEFLLLQFGSVPTVVTIAIFHCLNLV